MTDSWWLAERLDRSPGPFTREQIRQMLTDRDIRRNDLVWSSRTQVWTPARRALGPPRSTVGWILRGVAGVLLAGAYAAALSVSLMLIFSAKVEFWDPAVATVVWPVAGWGLLVASLGLVAAWGRPGALGALRPELGAARSVSVAFLVLTGVVAASLALYQQSDAIETINAMHRMSYAVRVDQARSVIQVEGDIGLRFADSLDSALAKPDAPRTIEVTSLGGLVDEALPAAKTIERYRAKVVVRRICTSACLLLLAAGEERWADLGARLDFHAVAPVAASTRPAVLWRAKQQAAVVRAFFETRGVPADVLDTAFRIGPTKVESLSALEALDLHILTGVLDGEAVVGRARLERALAMTPRRIVRSAVYDEID